MLTPPARRLIRMLLNDQGLGYQEAYMLAKQYERASPLWRRKMVELGLSDADVAKAVDDSKPAHVTRVR